MIANLSAAFLIQLHLTVLPSKHLVIRGNNSLILYTSPFVISRDFVIYQREISARYTTDLHIKYDMFRKCAKIILLYTLKPVFQEMARG